MSEKRSDIGTIIALAMIAIGVWMLFNGLFADLWAPIAKVLDVIAAIAWPLALIAIGVLILRKANGGTSMAGIRGKRLYRSRHDRMISGVLGGLAQYLSIDTTVMRVAFVVLAVFNPFVAPLLYIAAAIIMPEEPVGGVSQPAAEWPEPTGHETVQTPNDVPDSGPDANA